MKETQTTPINCNKQQYIIFHWKQQITHSTQYYSQHKHKKYLQYNKTNSLYVSHPLQNRTYVAWNIHIWY